MKLLMNKTLKTARRIIILILGSTVILFGIILLFTPGPACVVIPAGIAILATEFVWAQQLLRKLKQQGTHLAHNMGLGNSQSNPTSTDSFSDTNQ